jgi:tetraacyldisaccharide 4'-kinase
VSQLRNKKLFLFCGIAKPESFFFLLQETGLKIGGTRTFADHHRFTAKDLDQLCKSARLSACEGLVTTEKDFVKIKGLPVSLPVWVAPLVLTASDEFDQFVLNRVAAASEGHVVF